MRKPKRYYDGVEIMKMDPVIQLGAYIMPRKTDSQVNINLRMPLGEVEKFIKEHKEDIPGLTLYHILFASINRACAENPEINRFIKNNTVFQRETVTISMMVKRKLSKEEPEATIYPTFKKTDSLADIVKITNEKMEEAFRAEDEGSNSFDKLLAVLSALPTWVIRGFINFMMYLEAKGKLPKALVESLPFHSGFFVTNIGSIGLPVLCHHLYEFGTVSVFVAMGAKETDTHFDRNGNAINKRVLPISAVIDSRICDGFAYSCAFRTIRRCFLHPEMLLEGYQEGKKSAQIIGGGAEEKEA